MSEFNIRINLFIGKEIYETIKHKIMELNYNIYKQKKAL